MPTVEYAVYIYLFINIFIYIFIYRFVRVHSTVNDSLRSFLFTMPGMQRVDAKSSKVLAATSCCLLFIPRTE